MIHYFVFLEWFAFAETYAKLLACLCHEKIEPLQAIAPGPTTDSLPSECGYLSAESHANDRPRHCRAGARYDKWAGKGRPLLMYAVAKRGGCLD